DSDLHQFGHYLATHILVTDTFIHLHTFRSYTDPASFRRPTMPSTMQLALIIILSAFSILAAPVAVEMRDITRMAIVERANPLNTPNGRGSATDAFKQFAKESRTAYNQIKAQGKYGEPHPVPRKERKAAYVKAASAQNMVKALTGKH
ncbi:hypothetical protein CALCODRAFT_78649, partial [Calocera cornea HHB12733]